MPDDIGPDDIGPDDVGPDDVGPDDVGPDAIERAAAILGDRARRRVPIGPLTTYRVGGPAALYVEATGEGDVDLVRRAVEASGVPVLVVGRGSNLLVSDRGFSGLAVVLAGGFGDIAVEGTEVRAGAAVSLPVLARRTAAAGLTGLEWAVGVPGSVGGAVRMNAGGHGSDVSRTLVSATVVPIGTVTKGGGPDLDGEVAAARLHLAYRRSALTAAHLVTGARFALASGDREVSEREIAEIVRWRRQHQPGGTNAGSVFTNPPGAAAGRLIEEAGLKGFRQGSAHVSEKHANFVQVDEGGSADDVAAVIAEVARLVAERTGVALNPELHLVGFPDPRLEVES